MASISEDILADLDFGDQECYSGSELKTETLAHLKKPVEESEFCGNGPKDPDSEEEINQLELKMQKSRENDIAKLVASGKQLESMAKVFYSKTFQDIVENVRSSLNNPRFHEISSEHEYETILTANNLIPEIESDIAIVHKVIVDNWSPRLPELFSLVRNPIEYAKIVMALGNSLTPSCNLGDLLPPAVEMVVLVALSAAAATSSKTATRELEPEKLDAALKACKVALELDSARSDILAYIEKRMNLVAPNLSNLVGPSIAARLVGAAGGLSALCLIPACNILVLGRSKKGSVTGLSNIGTFKHRGFVWDCDIVRGTASEFRKRAAKLISAKVCLCARMDLSLSRDKSKNEGSYGFFLREKVVRNLEIAAAPPPARITKALPIPDDAPKKRRGGRRARKLKEQFAITELTKAANRALFGVPEEEIIAFDETRGLGMIKGAGTGRIRAIDAKTKAKTSDKLRQKLKAIGGIKTSLPGNSTSVNGSITSLGTATSLSFTPFQGLEFADPQSSRESAVQDANEKWFGRFMIKPPPKKE